MPEVLEMNMLELDGQGCGKALPEDGKIWRDDSAPMLWLNICGGKEEAVRYRWLYEESGLDENVLDSLTAHETRPRFYVYENGLRVNLRALNLNPDAEQDDLLSVRIWLEPRRIITITRDKVAAIDSISKDLRLGHGPMGPGDFLAELANNITLDMSDYLNKLDDEIDDLEDIMLEEDMPNLRQNIASVRRRIIHLRRYLVPEREVLMNLQTLKPPWLSDDNRFDLREDGDRLTRYLEILDTGRERAAVAADEFNSRINAQTNRTLFILSVVAVIFLPLTFLTGLLGINVGGIPGSESKYAFALVCVIMVLVAVLEYWLFRKKKWL